MMKRIKTALNVICALIMLITPIVLIIGLLFNYNLEHFIKVIFYNVLGKKSINWYKELAYLVLALCLIGRYYWIKLFEYKQSKLGQKNYYTCIRYITMNHKIFFFIILLFFQIIILDYFLSNPKLVFKDIWPLVAVLLSPFATSMYIIANNVWNEDKTRDKISYSSYLKTENETNKNQNLLANDKTIGISEKVTTEL